MKRYLAAATLAAIINTPQAAENWLATWQASPHAVWEASEFALPTGVPAVLERQTVRETARISVGGSRLRVVLSNRYGTQPLLVGEVRVGPAGETMRPLTFGGQASVVIPPGAPAVSDALAMPVATLQKLAVSVYLPEHTPLVTFHWGAQQTGAIVNGNRTADLTLEDTQSLHGRVLLSGIWVEAPAGAAGVVAAFGDSITDGNGSTPDQDRRWPDYLAARLSPGGVAVVNAGISGARLLGDRMGVNAAARFEQDVLSQPGVRTAIVLMGINDIGWPQSIFAPHEAPMAADRMIAAYRQLIAQAHARQVQIIGATLPPFEGTAIDGYYTPVKDALRRQVNQWIRESKEFDAVADMDALLRDPQQPSRMQARYDSGDHLHPGDAGYEAMAAEAARVLSRY
ncbi:SGNH/GDSL hydrolase family protein [Duganella levis]|uniref:SGNH/GDSL hydrolase family protein n=1 Tax=Duganella levis TaxID=2692169 RepID=A0ABW9W7T1_9BURK|nr:SGNH/GDSL hydrolase family protein [Duganella levis]MYN29654.1 SGNH/GDSL hydrolase family protein [Duganella levis]